MVHRRRISHQVREGQGGDQQKGGHSGLLHFVYLHVNCLFYRYLDERLYSASKAWFIDRIHIFHDYGINFAVQNDLTVSQVDGAVANITDAVHIM